MAMRRVMSVSNVKVNTFAPIPHTLLCVSLIMSVAINNPPAGATSNAEQFGNVNFSLINLEHMGEKHIYYYKVCPTYIPPTMSMFLPVSNRRLF